MPEGANARSPMDPAQFWQQWYDTSSKMWSTVFDGGKAPYVNPYSLYQSWLKSVGDAQGRMQSIPVGVMDPKEAWKQWFEATTESWRTVAEMGADPLGLTAHWLEMMEEARAKMQAEGSFPADPFTFLKQWYDATSEMWAKAVGDIIGTEKFMEGVSLFLESYTSFARTFRRANEEYFRNLQLPTRSDVARVAELIVALEEKVDRIEDAFEDFEDGHAHFATNEAVTTVTERLDHVEGKLDTFPAILKKLDAVESLAQRLDQVENKLDKVLAALEKFEAEEQAKPTNVALRKTTKKPQTSEMTMDNTHK